MSALDLTADQLWLPGKGLVPTFIAQAEKAVEEYDCDLMLGRHEQSGEWVVLIKRGPEGRPFPVMGLGNELPSVDEIKKRLFESDARRHGGELVAKIMRSQDARQKALRDEVNNQTGVAAEALEWGHRKQGTHPSPRIFVPGRS